MFEASPRKAGQLKAEKSEVHFNTNLRSISDLIALKQFGVGFVSCYLCHKGSSLIKIMHHEMHL